MQLIDAPNLATVLPDVPRDQIWPLLSQVASAARFLESRDLVHRDIKPDNIVISRDFANATLLDLGVIRPIGVGDLTDADQRLFIGTLRYSSPEFLLRNEKDTLLGWRSLTFYQLGAALHDMIMQKRIFGDITEPYARLVQAVERDVPKIEAADVPADLVFLARNCLVKDPDLRLKFVDWEQFEVPQPKKPRVADLKDRIRRRQASAFADSRPEAIALGCVAYRQLFASALVESPGFQRGLVGIAGLGSIERNRKPTTLTSRQMQSGGKLRNNFGTLAPQHGPYFVITESVENAA
jgi:eukaryotic-like serine/threonine-protein kinase